MRFLPVATPTPDRLTAVLAHVHRAVDDDDDDMDPALRACVQLMLASAHLVSLREPVVPLPLTVSALGMRPEDADACPDS